MRARIRDPFPRWHAETDAAWLRPPYEISDPGGWPDTGRPGSIVDAWVLHALPDLTDSAAGDRRGPRGEGQPRAERRGTSPSHPAAILGEDPDGTRGGHERRHVVPGP